LNKVETDLLNQGIFTLSAWRKRSFVYALPVRWNRGGLCWEATRQGI